MWYSRFVLRAKETPMRQTFDRTLRVRVPASLQARLDAMADRSSRTSSSLAREAIAIGLEHLTRRSIGAA